MFEDLLDFNDYSEDENTEEIHDREVWDSGLFWDSGSLPDNVWVLD